MQRYFAQKFAKQMYLDEVTSKHIAKVMRNNIGEHVYICIEKTYYEYEIISIGQLVEVKLVQKLNINNENDVKTTLVIPILKKDNHKIAMQKAIELGVNEIILYQASNSVVKWTQSEKKIEKLEQFIIDACRQSFRNQIVDIKFAKLDKLDLSLYDCVLYGDETQNKVSSLNLKPGTKVCFISGCEGGFSSSEYDYFAQNNVKPISLAKTILRAETAPIAFASYVSMCCN